MKFGTFTSLAPETIRRTFGLVNWRSDQITTSERPMGAFGMCVVSAEANAVGASAIPGPFSDADSDLWFVHQFLFAPIRFASAVGFDTVDGRQYPINSKAMRKVTDDEVVVVMIENGHATQGATAWISLRVLASLAARS